jgi:hypothetical protein
VDVIVGVVVIGPVILDVHLNVNPHVDVIDHVNGGAHVHVHVDDQGGDHDNAHDHVAGP